MAHPQILGINFGDSYASIAVIGKEGHADCIANEDGERQIACAISYNGEEVYIGNGATGQLVKNSANTITGFRNLLGKSFSEASSKKSATLLPSTPVVDVSGAPGFTVSHLVKPKPAAPVKGGRSAPASGAATPAAAEPVPAQLTLTASEATTIFLKTLFQSAVDFLGSEPTNGCVIAAPAYFTAAQRKALKEAAEAAGMKVLQVIDESAAVLVGYRAGLVTERHDRGLAPIDAEGEELTEKADKIVAVVDMGETGTSVEVVAVRDGQYVHLGAGAAPDLGGREFDKLLISHFAKEFTKKTKVPLTVPIADVTKADVQDLRAQAKLVLAVEHTKRSLSASSGAATCAVESLKDGADLSGSINRLRFDGLASGVYRQVGAKVKEVVSSVGLELVQIDEVLLAGSSTLFPGLTNYLQLLFPESTAISSTLDPSQAIAIGCALQALHLSQLPESLKMEDVLALAPHEESTTAPIGIVVPGQKTPVFTTIIDKNTPLPARRSVAFPVAKGAKSVAIEIWEGAESIKTEKAPPAPRDPDDSDDEEEEPQEIKTVVLTPTTFIKGVETAVSGTKQVVLSLVVLPGGKITVDFAEEK